MSMCHGHWEHRQPFAMPTRASPTSWGASLFPPCHVLVQGFIRPHLLLPKSQLTQHQPTPVLPSLSLHTVQSTICLPVCGLPLPAGCEAHMAGAGSVFSTPPHWAPCLPHRNTVHWVPPPLAFPWQPLYLCQHRGTLGAFVAYFRPRGHTQQLSSPVQCLHLAASCFLKINHTILWVPKHPWDAYTSWMVPAMWQWLCSFLLFKIGSRVGLRQKEEAWTSTIYY